ncbi:MAG: Fur family transcriptional regulator [Desulfocapsaceae bacterium]|nr:Fur family transcriptional regulator [Desulfocapsaceae bacterium]
MHLRMTNQRERILQELQKSGKHLTADELFKRVKKVMPRISLATVYRNLETLSAAGIINKLEISGRRKRFDYDVSDHDHIYCVHCHRVDNVPLDRTSIKTPSSVTAHGYRITGFRLEFAGLCPACSGKKERVDTKIADE